MELKVEEKWKRKKEFGKGKSNYSGKNFRGKGYSWKKDKLVAVVARPLTKEGKKIVTLIQEETIEEEGLSIEEGQIQEEVMDHLNVSTTTKCDTIYEDALRRGMKITKVIGQDNFSKKISKNIILMLETWN